MKQKRVQKKVKKILSMAALLSLQTLPNFLHAQSVTKDPAMQHSQSAIKTQNDFLKITLSALANQKMDLVAILKGEPLFKNGKGELFTIDIATGDIKTVSKAEYAQINYFEKQMFGIFYKIKPANKGNSLKEIKGSVTQKGRENLNEIKVIGIDKDGHVIQETAKGERFFLDPATGDMVDYNGHIAQYKQ